MNTNIATPIDATQQVQIALITAEVSQTLGGYKRSAGALGILATIDDAAWARQAQALIDAQAMRVLNAFSPQALAAIASNQVSVSWIAGGLNHV
jgi:hypothetical protein